jgi:hypothetical protein
VSAISSDTKRDNSPSSISAPPAYSRPEFGELFKQQQHASNDANVAQPMSASAPQQPQQVAVAAPIVVSPSPFADVSIPTPATLNMAPAAPKPAAQTDFVAPVQMGMFPSMQAPQPATVSSSSQPQQQQQQQQQHPSPSIAAASSSSGKLVLKSLDVTPLSDDEKSQIQQRLMILMSSGASSDRKVLEAIIALISGGSTAQEVEVDIEKLDTPTLRQLQRIISGDVEIVNKLSVRASNAQEAKQRFMNGVEEKLRKDTFDLVSDVRSPHCVFVRFKLTFLIFLYFGCISRCSRQWVNCLSALMSSKLVLKRWRTRNERRNTHRRNFKPTSNAWNAPQRPRR